VARCVELAVNECRVEDQLRLGIWAHAKTRLGPACSKFRWMRSTPTESVANRLKLSVRLATDWCEDSVNGQGTDRGLNEIRPPFGLLAPRLKMPIVPNILLLPSAAISHGIKTQTIGPVTHC
jgi:hypothetical protein